MDNIVETVFIPHLGISAKVGMRIEACDNVNVWSTAKIIKVTQKGIEIHYEGWGKKYNETFDLGRKNIEQVLAKVGTHTMRFKGMVDIFIYKNKQNKLTRWPCVVNLRAPNPWTGVEEYEMAENELRGEKKILIHPYTVSSRKYARGMWVDVKYVHRWNKNTDRGQGEKSGGFNEAYNTALKDDSVLELPLDLFEEGTLINTKFRQKLADLKADNRDEGSSADQINSNCTSCKTFPPKKNNVPQMPRKKRRIEKEGTTIEVNNLDDKEIDSITSHVDSNKDKSKGRNDSSKSDEEHKEEEACGVLEYSETNKLPSETMTPAQKFLLIKLQRYEERPWQPIPEFFLRRCEKYGLC